MLVLWLKNLFPSPSPLEAPSISPAISTNSTVAGTIGELYILDSSVSRESGTGTTPIFGSIVAKGKLATYACCFLRSALNSVDLPTFGRPTIPTESAMGVFYHRENKNIFYQTLNIDIIKTC